jgi:hypothetical protein
MPTSNIDWQFFPKSVRLPPHLEDVIKSLDEIEPKVSSLKHKLESDKVLAFARNGLEELGYKVETGKKDKDKIQVPVLFGKNGKLEKYFDADAFSKSKKTVIEIEAGRGVTNYQFLKDLFQACMMHDVDYLVIGVRKIYRTSKDFDKVSSFIETLYASNRLELPLKGILIIGY